MGSTPRLLTRAVKSAETYLRRGERLIKRFQEETGRVWEDEPAAVVEWLTFKAPGLRKSSFRIYRLALCAFMEQYGPVEAVRALQAIPVDLAGLRPKPYATSAAKLKSVPLDLFHAIIGDLETSSSVYADMLVCWITCNSILGLRPVEWRQATLTGSLLSCRTAKYSNGRGRKGKREIDLNAVHPYFLDAARKLLEERDRFYLQGIAFEQMYASCSQLLLRTQKKLFPGRSGHITLYSTRHQSVANSKYAGASREEIAVMYGHSSLETAVRHYARKKYGRAFFRQEEHLRDNAVMPVAFEPSEEPLEKPDIRAFQL